MTTPTLDELVLLVGSVRPFRIDVIDENGDPLDLSGVTRAALRVATSLSATTDILAIDTDTELVVGATSIIATLSQVQADALTAGSFIADLAFEIGGEWQQSDPFKVHVKAVIAEHLA